MTKNHLKSLMAPKSWVLMRKARKFVTMPNPCGHSRDMCVPATIVLKDYLSLASTRRELRKLLHRNEVNVDKRRIRDIRFPIGYLDVIQIPAISKHYRMVMNEKGKLSTIETDEKETVLKPLRVIGKKTLNGQKTQLNCNDGRNILIEKDTYKIGDTILFDLSSKSIKNSFKFEKGSFIQLIGGKHKGKTGIVEDLDGNLVKVNFGKGSVVTLKKYAFVLGAGKESIKVK